MALLVHVHILPALLEGTDYAPSSFSPDPDHRQNLSNHFPFL